MRPNLFMKGRMLCRVLDTELQHSTIMLLKIRNKDQKD